MFMFLYDFYFYQWYWWNQFFFFVLIYSENGQLRREKLGKVKDRSFYLINENVRDNGQLVKSIDGIFECGWSNFINVYWN